jgi:hypothetical protein
MSFSAERAHCISRRAWLYGTVAALAGIPAAAQQPRRLPPPGGQPADAALSLFLDRMREIVASRNTAALTALMAPEFRVEFDVGKGPQVFRSHWRPDAENSPVWAVLGKALAVQGDFYLPSLFCIPYVYKSFPMDLDPLAHVVAVGEGATLRDRPAPDGAAVGKIRYSIIQLAEPLSTPVIIPDNKFLAVDDPGAGRCYAAGSEVYSPAAHRMFFERRSGRWRWISLAAATLADPPVLKRQIAKA